MKNLFKKLLNNIFNKESNFKYKDKSFSFEDSFSINNISNLKIFSDLLDIKIYSTESEKVFVKSNLKGNFEEKPKLIIDIKNNCAEIYVDLGDYDSDITSDNANLEIFIPKSFKGITNVENTFGNVFVICPNLNIGKIKTIAGVIFS